MQIDPAPGSSGFIAQRSKYQEQQCNSQDKEKQRTFAKSPVIDDISAYKGHDAEADPHQAFLKDIQVVLILLTGIDRTCTVNHDHACADQHKDNNNDLCMAFFHCKGIYRICPVDICVLSR